MIYTIYVVLKLLRTGEGNYTTSVLTCAAMKLSEDVPFQNLRDNADWDSFENEHREQKRRGYIWIERINCYELHNEY